MLKTIVSVLLVGFSMHAFAQKSTGLSTLKGKNDSVTIIGRYNNYLHEPGQVFSVLSTDRVSTRELKFSAPIDAKGRFRLTFPISAAGQILLDPNRISAFNVAIPGETIYLNAELGVPPASGNPQRFQPVLKGTKEKPGLRFEGKNARLHNEIRQYEQELADKFPTGLAMKDTTVRIEAKKLQYIRSKKPSDPRTLHYFETYRLLPVKKVITN